MKSPLRFKQKTVVARTCPKRVAVISVDFNDQDIAFFCLQLYLNDVSLDFPIDSKQACSAISKILDTNVPLSAIEDLLQKFAAQQLIELVNDEH